eukprot:1367379-Amphidinium_carterae.1
MSIACRLPKGPQEQVIDEAVCFGQINLLAVWAWWWVMLVGKALELLEGDNEMIILAHLRSSKVLPF